MILYSLNKMQNIACKHARNLNKMLMIIFFICLIIMLGYGLSVQAGSSDYEENLQIPEEIISIFPDLVYDFVLTLIDNKGKIVETIEYTNKPPWVIKVRDDFYEIGYSAGPLISYVLYFDTSLGEVTRLYFNPIYLGDNLIAHREDSNLDDSLVIEEIFSDNGVYMEIARDFSLVAIGIEAISEVTLIDENTIRLVYLQGKNYREITEEIKIH